ncbi:MAG TPA: hypothetical protein VG407_06790 [Caulobacteraceae bacterium]|jgi:hypothetical protein|nr:hypothetical protein [Caulobacteraceae bacterium]
MLGSFDFPENRRAPEGAGLCIRPEVFLYPAWSGTGLLCDAFGIPREEYALHGAGHTEDDGTIVIEYESGFNGGIVNSYSWAFRKEPGDLLYAYDRLNGIEAKGRMTVHGWRWSFFAVGHTPFGRRRCKVEIAYRVVSPHEATSAVTLSMLGVTVGTGSTHIKHCSAINSQAA